MIDAHSSSRLTADIILDRLMSEFAQLSAKGPDSQFQLFIANMVFV